ncbi:hypothetical protein ACOME3_009310 [Neoechinorhynchus agilis]
MHHMDIVHHHQQHDEDVLRKGVIYSLKYLGFVEVLCSMRAIGYNERYTLTRSCIANVAKASKTNVHVDTAAFKELVIKGMVSIDAHAMRGGLDVLMTVSVNFIKLIQRTTRDLLVLHPVEQVSFVSVGDPPNSACVGYIAKDKTKRRYCYVFESFSGTASLVMASFRQAFTLKYKDSLMNPQNANDVNATTTVKSISQRSSNASQGKITEELERSDDSSSLHETKRKMASSCSDSPDVTENLDNEPWYHGPISRPEAEALLKEDGDFLVRKSSNVPDQYVLSGKYNGKSKHLLLIDPDGSVRTKGLVFSNISSLIYYHQEKTISIVSPDSQIVLIKPVCRNMNGP